jgi:hypothetical protein
VSFLYCLKRGLSSPPRSGSRLDSSCCGRDEVLEIFLGRVGSAFVRVAPSVASGARISLRESITEDILFKRLLISLALLS